MGVAQRFYGDAAYWTRIYEANQYVIGTNPNQLHVGQQLMLPDLQQAQPIAGIHIYMIEPTDLSIGLRGIAARFYDDPQQWQRIYDINRGTLGDDPFRLKVGQVLLIA
jgi:nucleoid-associated protein YgaU